tara:strand:- start:1368 stop:1529 length:162 start_codon:yes stop_codon:yes gene_type:complete
MNYLTYTQNAWIDNLVNREGITKDEATQYIIDICKNIKSNFISYEDIQNEIYK